MITDAQKGYLEVWSWGYCGAWKFWKLLFKNIIFRFWYKHDLKHCPAFTMLTVEVQLVEWKLLCFGSNLHRKFWGFQKFQQQSPWRQYEISENTSDQYFFFLDSIHFTEQFSSITVKTVTLQHTDTHTADINTQMNLPGVFKLKTAEKATDIINVKLNRQWKGRYVVFCQRVNGKTSDTSGDTHRRMWGHSGRRFGFAHIWHTEGQQTKPVEDRTMSNDFDNCV